MSKKPVKKAFGFYVSFLSALISIAGGVLYAYYFRGVDYTHGPLFSVPAFWLLVLGGVAGIICLFVRHLEGYAPAIIGVCSGFATLMYIHKMVWPIADVFTAIDPVKFAGNMYILFGVLVAAFIVSEVGLYLRKVKPVVRPAE